VSECVRERERERERELYHGENNLIFNEMMIHISYNMKILKVFIKFCILKGIKCDSENMSSWRFLLSCFINVANGNFRR
jgi:hypothetical protein